MKRWQRLAALLLAGSMLADAIPAAAVSEKTQPLGLEDIKAIQAYVHDGGYAGSGREIDVNGDGVIDVFDLALAKRSVTTSGVPSLAPLAADCSDVYLDTPTDVTFTVQVTEVAPLAEGAVQLLDADGTALAAMHDDGTDGDEKAADGIYTAVVTLTGDEIATVAYRAAAMGVESEPFEVAFYRDLEEKEKEGFEALMQRLCAMEFVKACSYAENCDEITSVEFDEAQQIIFFETIYHISGMWVPPEWRVQDPTEPPQDPTEPPQDPTEPPQEPTDAPQEPSEGYDWSPRKLAPVEAQDAQASVNGMLEDGEDVGPFADVPDMTYENGEPCTWIENLNTDPLDTVSASELAALDRAKGSSIPLTPKRVAVICPFYHDLGDEVHAVSWGNDLASSLGSGSAEVFKDTSWFGVSNEVTLDRMKQLGGYGAVILSTKSYRKKTDIYGDEYLLLGTQSKWDADDADIQSGRVAITSVSFLTCRYAVGKGFFEKYYGKDSLSGSFWYINSPGAMGNEAKADSGIADMLISRGASTVVGYNSSITDSGTANEILDSIFGFLFARHTLAQAVSYLNKSIRSAIVVKGRKDYSIAKAAWNGQISNSGMYWQIPTITAAPGERVIVPIYVYHDVGTIGCSFRSRVPDEIPGFYPSYCYAYRDYTDTYDPYHSCKFLGTNCHPGNYKEWYDRCRWLPQRAADGSIMLYDIMRIPSDCPPGEYPITIEDPVAFCADGSTVTPKVYNGVIHVVKS
ncbi:MAG: hypothetical protein IKI21_04380 [Oscillospiraceae bacterium]|nr:hypothetical protein [Oscillospiraceae bacterium]